MKLTIRTAKNLKQKPDEANLGFGEAFTDHMFNMDYTPELGWHNPRIEPYGPFTLDPATMVLHYGQASFEGLKAFRTASGKVQFFRPEEHLRRLNRSNEIMCIPKVEVPFALDALKELVKIDKDWVPRREATSLYIRPVIMATDPYLGVRVSRTYRFFIILCAVGPYYPEGFKPTKLIVETERVRAIAGGVGEAKTPANYAASLLASSEAKEAGYSQVIWLDGREHRFVEEAGSMNIFFVIDDEVATPSLQGSILPGITRDSILHLGKKWGLKMRERPISIDEVRSAAEKGGLQEVFGTGTAAVISPVGEIKYRDEKIAIGKGRAGPVAERFYRALTDIQYGRDEGPKGWVLPLM
jgi:branched-chain amino acid aminotransferase